jgi:hypothetical protein
MHISATMAALTELPEAKPNPPMAVRQATMMVPPNSNIGRLPVFSTMNDDVNTVPISMMLSRAGHVMSVRRTQLVVPDAIPT